MLKLFFCLFVEKNPKMQAQYDAKTSYMTGLSKLVLGIAAVILPIMGFLPSRTMDKMADMVMNYMRSGPMHHEVHYFTWVNLKGSLISIGIGLIVYFCIIRKFFIKNGARLQLIIRANF